MKFTIETESGTDPDATDPVSPGSCTGCGFESTEPGCL
jgi:hypothetical protein